MEPSVRLPEELKVDTMVSPFGDGTNNSNVLYLAFTSTAASFLVPDDWQGALIETKVIGADAYWFFSEQTTTKPDSAATAAGADLGWLQRDGEIEPHKVPRATVRDGAVYFLIDGSGAGVMWVRKSSPQ